MSDAVSLWINLITLLILFVYLLTNTDTFLSKNDNGSLSASKITEKVISCLFILIISSAFAPFSLIISIPVVFLFISIHYYNKVTMR
jgi:glucan phosphoethanolaminetransferase (alkaline phosphatase superfamily)